MDTEWPFVFLGLAIGVALGSGGAAFFHNRAHDAGNYHLPLIFAMNTPKYCI